MTAQPKARRNQQQATQQQQQNKQQGQQMTQRARLQYPVAVDMPEDVVWRRDIYREVDLNEGSNAALYYPVQPNGKQMNLFTYIFKLAQNGYIPIYEYSPTESEERFTDAAKRSFKDMLDDQGVFYEEKNGKIVVDNSDIPSEEVRRYFLKESAYYDQANATFHRKVLALCPVRMSAFPTKQTEQNSKADADDDFSFGSSDYGDEPPRPMFWVKFSDLAPFLNRQNVMTSDINNAATMNMEDFFTLNRYQGNIYKTNNMLGQNLADYCKNDSALAKEQKRIEKELENFRNNIFGDKARRDSLDSIAAADPKAAKAEKKKRARTEKTEKASSRKSKSSGSSSGSSAARISVRRQRH
jgi:gliding motility associated protien GldN